MAGRFKTLKGDPKNNVSILKILSIFSYDKKPKYVELFYRLYKKNPKLLKMIETVKIEITEKYGINKNVADSFSDFELLFLGFLVNENIIDSYSIQNFIKFCDYNEKNLIKENDIGRYKSFNEVTEAVQMADINVEGNLLEKKVKVLLNNDDWLVLRPLSYESALKYGAMTKWCVTTKTKSFYFEDYSKKGVLIFCIKKKTNYKVACMFDLAKKEMSFWDVTDKRVDSLQVDLPDDIREIISEECFDKNVVSNEELSKTFYIEDDKNEDTQFRRNMEFDVSIEGLLNDLIYTSELSEI